jgi:hypothetical protein
LRTCSIFYAGKVLAAACALGAFSFRRGLRHNNVPLTRFKLHQGDIAVMALVSQVSRKNVLTIVLPASTQESTLSIAQIVSNVKGR